MAKDFKVVRRRHGLYNEFEVKGLDMLDRELERMGKELASQLGKQAVEKALRPVASRVKTNISMAGFKGTGALRDSVRTTVHLSNKPRGIRGDVRVGTDRRGKYKRAHEKVNEKLTTLFSLNTERARRIHLAHSPKDLLYARPSMVTKDE